MTIPEWTKPATWGAIGGAIVIAIVGLSAGWVVTSSSATEQARQEANQAVISALTPICVAKFEQVTEVQQKKYIAALEAESSWQRGDYVEKHGWATMPGKKEPRDEVAEACAGELLDAAAA